MGNHEKPKPGKHRKDTVQARVKREQYQAQVRSQSRFKSVMRYRPRDDGGSRAVA